MSEKHASFEKAKLVRLIAGSVVFAAALVLEKFFHLNSNAALAIFILSFLILGGDVILRALKNIIRGEIFDENFLMSIATTGAFVIGEHSEAAAVMLFYQIGEAFQDMAVENTKSSITNLMNIRPDYANLIRNGVVEKAAPEIVSPGDLIIVKPGEKIPLDGIITEGQSLLDVSALTGESIPKEVFVSSEVLSGCVNKTGKLTIRVTKTFGESTVSKIIDLVENASGKKAKAENFITVFAKYYTPAVVVFAVLLALLPPLCFGGEWLVWINRALVFLVISCPCALVLSIPMSYFAGLGRAAKTGILIKGGNYLEALNNLEIAVFDKTGTLTKGNFKVSTMQPAKGFTQSELLELAACAQTYSNHPIALSIMSEYAKEIDKAGLSGYTEHSGYGVSVYRNEKMIIAGNQKLMEKNGMAFNAPEKSGTVVYVAFDNVFAGSIVISDEIKPDSFSAVSALRHRGVKRIVMLTGDAVNIAQETALELGLDEYYGGLLPQEKVEKMEALIAQKSAKGKLIFTGDGINDAPVLAMADIGIAMGGIGSDAAIEAADAVLMTDEPSKLASAIDIARFTKRVVWQNIVFVLGVKFVFLALGAFGIASMWEAVFADVGVCLITVLNAMRIIGRKTITAGSK